MTRAINNQLKRPAATSKSAAVRAVLPTRMHPLNAMGWPNQPHPQR